MMSEDVQDEFEVVTTIIRLLKPLDQTDQNRIIQTVRTFYSLDKSDAHILQTVPTSQNTQVIASHHSGSTVPYSEPEQQPISAKEFIMEKMPQSDMERVACLAYYLAHYREQPYFKNLDLDKLNTEAAQPRFSNLSKSAGNALTNHYLALAPTKGMKQISAHGEAYVRALPDRAAAKNTMKNKPKRKTSKTPAKKRVNPNGR